MDDHDVDISQTQLGQHPHEELNPRQGLQASPQDLYLLEDCYRLSTPCGIPQLMLPELCWRKISKQTSIVRKKDTTNTGILLPTFGIEE